MTQDDAVPVISQTAPQLRSQPVPAPTYDWRSLIRDYLVPLTRQIDPDNGLMRELLSRGVISEWNADTFQVGDIINAINLGVQLVCSMENGR